MFFVGVPECVMPDGANANTPIVEVLNSNAMTCSCAPRRFHCT